VMEVQQLGAAPEARSESTAILPAATGGGYSR